MREQIREQVMEGQHRANKIAHEIRNALNELSSTAEKTFKEELQNQINVMFKYHGCSAKDNVL